MARTEAELERAARAAEAWLDSLDPATVVWEDPADLREVAHAAQAVDAAEERLRAAVVAARVQGRSWSRIGLALGVSKQAAAQRFGGDVPPVPAARKQTVAKKSVARKAAPRKPAA